MHILLGFVKVFIILLCLGFSDSELERPRFKHVPTNCNVPLVLSEDHQHPVVQVGQINGEGGAYLYYRFSDRVGLPLHNIPSPFPSVMDIFFVDFKFGHIHFYTL